MDGHMVSGSSRFSTVFITGEYQEYYEKVYESKGK